MHKITPDKVKEWVDTFRAAPENQGRFPNARSTKVPGQDVSWRAINDAFIMGHVVEQRMTFGLWLKMEYAAARLGKTSPSAQEAHPVSPIRREYNGAIVFPKEALREAVNAFRNEFNGTFPNAHCGIIPGTHFTWSALDNAMKKGNYFSNTPEPHEVGKAPRHSLKWWLIQEFNDYVDGLRANENEPVSRTVSKKRVRPS